MRRLVPIRHTQIYSKSQEKLTGSSNGFNNCENSIGWKCKTSQSKLFGLFAKFLTLLILLVNSVLGFYNLDCLLLVAAKIESGFKSCSRAEVIHSFNPCYSMPVSIIPCEPTSITSVLEVMKATVHSKKFSFHCLIGAWH